MLPTMMRQADREVATTLDENTNSVDSIQYLLSCSGVYNQSAWQKLIVFQHRIGVEYLQRHDNEDLTTNDSDISNLLKWQI